MVPGDLINEGAWDKIEQLTREAVQTMLGFELAHVGVNAENEEEAMKAANRFAFIFGMPAKAGNSSVFAGTALEVMKTPYLWKEWTYRSQNKLYRESGELLKYCAGCRVQ